MEHWSLVSGFPSFNIRVLGSREDSWIEIVVHARQPVDGFLAGHALPCQIVKSQHCAQQVGSQPYVRRFFSRDLARGRRGAAPRIYFSP
jgi:hypothetical protein